MELYNLKPLIHKGAIYCEIRKTMYGHSASGRLANDKLVQVLKNNDFEQSELIPGLFKHQTRPLAFSLIVDDFGVKYVGKDNAEYLIKTLEDNGYTITVDWTGSIFCGITLKWDYINGTVDLSMPGYIKKALTRFAHIPPTKPEDSPHECVLPTCGQKIQYAKDPDSTQHLDEKGIKTLQEIVGVLLYYARAIDCTMLPALGSLSAAQTRATEATAKACTKLLNYAATHPNATIRFAKSGMILRVHSDASYLSETEARSRAGGFFYLGDNTADTAPDSPPSPINGAIHINCSIMGNVMASATEAEVGALFHNAQDGCTFRQCLDFLGHVQPATPIQTDNACAEGIINDTVKQKRSKAIDMRFYWVRDRVRQGQFLIYWKPGKENKGDYFTKHHPTSHHREVRPIYLHEHALLLVEQHDSLQGCVDLEDPFSPMNHQLELA